MSGSSKVTRFADEAPAHTTTQKGGRNDAPSSSLPLVIGGVVVVVLAVGLGFIFLMPGHRVETVQPTAVAVQPTAIPAPTVSPIATYIPLIEKLIEQGDYQTAIATAEGALSVPNISDDERRVLTGFIISAGMKDLYSQPFLPTDRAQHQRMVDTYLSLTARARDAAIPIDTPLQLAGIAHASSQFQLARAAIEQAYRDGAFDPELDRDATRLYVSALYGIGEWYTTAEEGSELYEEGVQALVASDLIADHYQTGRSEAEVLLEQLGYPSKVLWPDPLDTPLLP